MVHSVITNGAILSTSTPTAFAAPMASAMSRHTTRPLPTSASDPAICAMQNTLVIITTEPTDRSMPPTSTTTAWPSAMMPSAEAWRDTSSICPMVTEPGTSTACAPIISTMMPSSRNG